MSEKLSAREAAILSQIDGLIASGEPIAINFGNLSKTVKGKGIADMLRKKLKLAGYSCENRGTEIEAYIPVPSSSFGASFSEMFLDRISNNETYKPLQALEAYREAQTAYSSLCDSIFDTEAMSDKKAVQELIRALHRIQDIETEYIYRLGMQEGLSMRGPDFLISGIK